MSDLVVNVRQVSSYPQLTAASGTEQVLVQAGGLGSPYQTLSTGVLVATALSSGSMGIGYSMPANVAGGQLFSGNFIAPINGGFQFNVYLDNQGVLRNWGSGLGADWTWGPDVGGFLWRGFVPGTAGQPASGFGLMSLSTAGALALPFGTLTVARDPAAALEVATMGWVGNHTVASFNNRNGVVQLWSSDIYSALCLDSAIASQNWVNQAISNAIQNMLWTCPFVNRWNGRTGSVYLTLSDITCVFFQPGQQPITPTPPLTSNDNSIATTAWVVEFLTNELAGGGTNFATQAWVLANTVNSFNGRMGVVTLTLADVTNVGGAPLSSPNFSGIPTAPTANVGQATGQIATTAFVQTAIANSVAGVASFNTRTGAVTLEAADITAAGGLSNPSPNLTGNPTAPTQAPGTNTPTIANCEFVTSAINAAVTSFNTRTGAVTLLLSDVTGVGGAPIASPTFTGVPAAPTANAGTNTTQIATTAFVSAALATSGGVSSFNGRTGAVELEANDISAAGGLMNPSPQLTGTPLAPTATAGTNTNQIATTAFVITTIGSSAVSSFNTRTGAVTLSATDITGAGGALLASPTFTGTPQAPTATAGTNNTQIATTAYVTAAIAADTTGVTSFNTRVGAVTLTTADITGAGGAPNASPSLTGAPLAPTAAPGTATTQIATTAFVAAAIAASGVTSFNGRTGSVTLLGNDISAAGGALIASPTFTGIPAGPTASPGTNTTQLATTAYVANYLPLSGGTLTGTLNGTAANFSGTLTDTAGRIISTNSGNGASVTVYDTSGTPFAGGMWASASGTSRLNFGSMTAAGLASSQWGYFDANANFTVSGALNSSSLNMPGVMTANSSGVSIAPILIPAVGINVSNAWAVSTTSMNCVVPAVFSAAIQVGGTGIMYTGVNAVNHVAFGWQSGGLGMYIDNTFQGLIQPQSDERLKENIQPSTVDCLASLVQLLLYSFDMPNKPNPALATVHYDVGFSAQQMQTLMADCVAQGPTQADGSSGILSVNFLPLIARCVGAIQQLATRLQALDGKAA